VEFGLSELKVTVSNLDSAAPEKRSDIKLDARLRKYSTISLAGTAMPFLPQPEIDLQGRIKSLDLPVLSPYAVRFISCRISSGHLDNQVKIRLIQNQLDVTNQLFIAKLEMDPAQPLDPAAVAGSSALPVSLPLGLLKNKNGDVSLELPISGRLDDPAFDLGSAIQQAVVLTVRKSTTSFLAPRAEISL